MWSPCTSRIISCKEGGAAWANLQKSVLKKLQRPFYLFVLVRCTVKTGYIRVWDCSPGLALNYPKDSYLYSSNSTGRGSVPHRAYSVHRSGWQRTEGRKRHGQGNASLKVMPKVKGRDENNALPSCLLNQCPIQPNLLTQDQHRSCSFSNFLTHFLRSLMLSLFCMYEILAAEVLTCKTAVPKSFLFKEQILCATSSHM